MSLVRKVTTEDFAREVLFSPVPVVVDVQTDRTGTCRVLTPLLEKSAEAYAGQIKFLQVNIDEDPVVAELYRVEGAPALLFFRDGRPAGRFVGQSDARSLEARLDWFATSLPPTLASA
jgi:thioredoxin 1